MRSSGLIVALAAVMLSTPALAQSWQAGDGSASAVLPAPYTDDRFSGGTLSCDEQKWTLRLAASSGAMLEAVGGPATLEIDRRTIETEATATLEGAALGVPYEAIEPLKAGIRLTVALAGGQEQETTFTLRGSRRAITAAQELCSPRSLPSENRVIFSPYSSYLGLARELREGAIGEFRAATNANPILSAAMLDLGDTGRLLFVQLCGSSWYYGVSGCNMTAFAAADDSDAWELVFDSEGAALYADRGEAIDGWPDLVTLPLRGPGEENRWRWDGERYAIQGAGDGSAEENETGDAG